jgi:hypothetical protein
MAFSTSARNVSSSSRARLPWTDTFPINRKYINLIRKEMEARGKHGRVALVNPDLTQPEVCIATDPYTMNADKEKERSKKRSQLVYQRNESPYPVTGVKDEFAFVVPQSCHEPILSPLCSFSIVLIPQLSKVAILPVCVCRRLLKRSQLRTCRLRFACVSHGPAVTLHEKMQT